LIILEIIHFDTNEQDIFTVIGLTFDYGVGLNLGIKSPDIGNCIIFWILFVFVIVQYNVLKSNFFEDSQVTNHQF